MEEHTARRPDAFVRICPICRLVDPLRNGDGFDGYVLQAKSKGPVDENADSAPRATVDNESMDAETSAPSKAPTPMETDEVEQME